MKNKKIYLAVILASVIAVAMILLDLLTKHFIVQMIPNVGDNMNVIPGFINFIFVKNTGAAWGMLAGRPVFLIVVSILVLALYIAFFVLKVRKHKEKTSLLLGISTGFIVGGCLGNMYDRIFLGYVRDFINFEFINFPVFNFADVGLTIGVILLIIYFIFIYTKEMKLEENKEKDEVENTKVIDFSNQPMLDEHNENNNEQNSDTYIEEKDTLLERQEDIINKDNLTENAHNLLRKNRIKDDKNDFGDKNEG